ncbi:MAG: aminopeptidase N [Arcticibacterium sp.]|jgi:aminopeptidase N
MPLKNKMKIFLGLLLFLKVYLAQSQEVYQASNTKDFDLIHTKLELIPDWTTNHLNGTAYLTLKPWFYEQDTLILDAKGLEIKSLQINGRESAYAYNDVKLSIPLGRPFEPTETIEVAIIYVAKPDELGKILAFKDIEYKGLYFINATDNNPQQIWSEGETEYNSCWFPTLDSPNQKHTQEVSLTIPETFESLSNGLLTSSKVNGNGTKTDTWKQELPHSVYLTMIAAGPFKKVVDKDYSTFEVSYYVEPEYEQEAVAIFGRTPEMINYFERILGIKYPWKKYAQIAVRNYISGAMENTSATVHGSGIQKTFNQLVDENDDAVIAHELFHHWFGDLVTAESWSNLPLNEAFANYSEYLWDAHKYGKDAADWNNFVELNQYLNESDNKQVSVIRFYHDDKEDMFDSHSYAKGGRILHMLRKEVGDKAFFSSLKLYLEQHLFENAEVHDLRQAFESVTGKDLNWFFEQWFLKPGHPRFHVEHDIQDKELNLAVSQQLDSVNSQVYNTLLEIEIGTNKGVLHKKIRVTKSLENFRILVPDSITYVSMDPEGYFLGVIDHFKSEEEKYKEFKNSPNAIARYKVFTTLTKEPENNSNEFTPNMLLVERKRLLVLAALEDKFWRIRELATHKFFNYDGVDFLKVEKALQSLIRIDEKSQVRAAGILAMKNFLNPQNDLLFRKALSDTSVSVKAAALEAILINDPPDGDSLTAFYSKNKDAKIFSAVANHLAMKGNPKDYNWFINRMKSLSGMELYQTMGILGTYLVSSVEAIQRQSIPFLKSTAMNERTWFGRFAAAQVLMLLMDNPVAMDALKEVFNTEQEQQLRAIYEQIPLD